MSWREKVNQQLSLMLRKEFLEERRIMKDLLNHEGPSVIIHPKTGKLLFKPYEIKKA